MEPSPVVVSRPERLTLDFRLTSALPGATLTRVVVVAGPAPPPRRLAGQLSAALGFDVAAELPREPGSCRRDGHLLVRAAPDGYARAGADAGGHVGDGGTDVVLAAANPAQAEALSRALVTATQRLRSWQPFAEQRTVSLWCPGPRQLDATRTGGLLGLRVLSARRTANEPANIKSPSWLAASAQVTAPGVRVRQHDVAWLRRHGFGGVLAVGSGSANPPNVTVLEHGRQHGGPHVVLVGKGITFDSGGLSLKPADAMTLMRTDMSGAAAVIAAIAAVQMLELPIRVTGLIACAENMPSGSAMRPGDVVRHVGGRTTEVRNTDAEGRLVLADCLAYATQRLAPDYLVDLATLTGAATVGLGRQHAALYSTDTRLTRALVRAGHDSGDRVWPMPLVPEYRSAIDSPVADAANANTDLRTGAGSVTAALFLQPFAAGTKWAHLDIAGVGRTESDRPDCRRGATGFGVSLLTHWLVRLAGRRL